MPAIALALLALMGFGSAAIFAAGGDADRRGADGYDYIAVLQLPGVGDIGAGVRRWRFRVAAAGAAGVVSDAGGVQLPGRTQPQLPGHRAHRRGPGRGYRGDLGGIRVHPGDNPHRRAAALDCAGWNYGGGGRIDHRVGQEPAGKRTPRRRQPGRGQPRRIRWPAGPGRP